MREMKDSGIPWVGEIPKNWEIIKGKYILIYLQRPILSTDKVITCFRDGEVTLRSNRREDGFTISEKEIGYQGIDVGDLVVHGMDGFAGSIGISDSRGKASPVLNVLNSSQDKKFLMYYLRSMAYNNVFLALSTGIRVRSCDLNWNKLANLPYAIPPINEQQRIADFLDAKCAKINSIKKNVEAEIETLKQYKKSVITEAVTKGLDKNVEMKESGIPWIGKIPKDWQLTRIKYTCNSRSEKAFFNHKYNKYLGLENVVGFSNEIIDTNASYADGYYDIYKYGDVLFSKLRPYLGKVLIATQDGFCTGEFIRLFNYHGDRRFLRYWMMNNQFINEVNNSTYGTKMPRANPEFIMNMPIPALLYKIQHRIADYLDTKCARIDSIIQKKQELLANLDTYKKSLIYEYVTGKKEVPAV